jgi:hypothetical protein
VAVTPTDVGKHLSGHARFLRYRDSDAELVDVLVGPQSTPRVLDVCEISTPDVVESAMAALGQDTFITHLDAGDVRVSVSGEPGEVLSPRHQPPLFPYVGGVEYEELTLHEPSELPVDGDISVTAFGGRDVGGFDVVATLPSTPKNVWATTVESPDGSLESATIGWDPQVDAGTDELVITVVQGLGRAQIRCRARDTGRFSIPASAFERIPALDAAATEIWVERLRRVPFAAPGIEWGELEVAVRYVVTTAAL